MEQEKQGLSPNDAPKVKEIKIKLSEGLDLISMKPEIFSDLYNFFNRYYKDGDFISLRRYKKDVYAIPYEGEEIKLHWTNNDQYYIKTTEYFKNYRFRLADKFRQIGGILPSGYADREGQQQGS